MRWFDKLDEEDPYRLQLRGVELVLETPIETYIYQMRQRVANFDSLPLEEQAAHIAVKQFENMQHFLEMHRLQQIRGRNENANQNNPAKGNARSNHRRPAQAGRRGR